MASLDVVDLPGLLPAAARPPGGPGPAAHLPDRDRRLTEELARGDLDAALIATRAASPGCG